MDNEIAGTQVISGMTMVDYLALKAFSSGMAHTIATKSPRHAWLESAWNPDRDSDGNNEADIGSAAHKCLLEGTEDGITVIEADDWRTKAAKELRDQAYSDGQIPMLAKRMHAVRAMVKEAKDYLATSDIDTLTAVCAPEQTITWVDEFGVYCKARPDWLNDKIMLHYKTTGNVSPQSFQRISDRMGYDMALVFYERALRAVKPDNKARHVILAQEQKAPYACKLFDLTAAKADVAEQKLLRSLNTWAACMGSGAFPMYDGSVHSMDVTPWEMAQAEEDMLTDEELDGGIPA